MFVGHSAGELAGARAVGLVTIAANADPDAEVDYFISQFSDLLELPILVGSHRSGLRSIEGQKPITQKTHPRL
jgi:hypothetical protein